MTSDSLDNHPATIGDLFGFLGYLVMPFLASGGIFVLNHFGFGISVSSSFFGSFTGLLLGGVVFWQNLFQYGHLFSST
jgi:hypothetical protein